MANSDLNKRISRFGGNIVRAQAVPDKTVLETVVDFIQDVAYSPNKPDDHEKVQWVQFERGDPNDLYANPDLCGESSVAPLIVVLGYTNGVQLWLVKASGEAQEVLSLRQGPVKVFRLLPSSVKPVFRSEDIHAARRPLAALCDMSSGQTFNSVRIISLKSGENVHCLNFAVSVSDVKANERVVVVTFPEKIIVHDACQFRQLFWISSCYPSQPPFVCPIALGSRWLAYADKRLVPLHQSGGGVAGETGQSYTATVISAAKTITKSLTAFGGTVANSLTGTKPSASKREPMVSPSTKWKPGIVTIIDVQGVKEGEVCVQEEVTGDGFVAHFPAHVCDPIAAMAFDTSGSLLLTCDTVGHTFHLFRIMAHQLCSSLGAVHHLYVLHRGDTEAKVQDIAFSLDSRWVSVSTKRGTTHVFPITPYGGVVNVRTHLSPRVVNRSSRFHRSAGLDDIGTQMAGGRDSPVQPASPSSSPRQHEFQRAMIYQHIINYNNPRLPPFPHPTVIVPLTQIHSTINIPGLSGAGSVQGIRTATGSTSSPDNYCVAACFGKTRGWVAGSSSSRDLTDSKRVAESIFLINWLGILVEYALQPHAKSGIEKVCDDSPLEMTYSAKAQWSLQRFLSANELKPPLLSSNPLLLASDALITQKTTDVSLLEEVISRNASKESLSSDYGLRDDETREWLSEIEIVTHEGPNRRLWMGPQFSFKTFQHASSAANVVSSSSAVLLSQSPDRPLSAGDVEETELQSLKLQSFRSNPVTMPGVLQKKRSFSGGSDRCSSPGQGMLIEAGSYEPPLTQWLMEVTPREGEDNSGDDRLKEILADALKESPSHDHFYTGLERELTDNLSTSSGSTHSVPRVQSFDLHTDNIPVFPPSSDHV